MNKYFHYNLGIIVASGVVLYFAMLSATFTITDVNSMRLSDYYYNYSQGYLHRGLVGSILQFFYGMPSEDLVQSVIPQFNFVFLRIIIVLLGVLLFVPLARLNITHSLRWLLFGYCTLILCAPIWRYENFYNHMDPYLYFFAIIGLLCILNRWPIVMVLPLIFGFLIHPLMVMYIALLACIVVHACATDKTYSDFSWHWLSSFGFVFILILVLNLVNDPNRNLILLTQYDYSYYHDFSWLKLDFLHTFENASNYILGEWRIQTKLMLLSLFLFLIIPLSLFILLGYELTREPTLVNSMLSNEKTKYRILQWLIANDKLFLISAGILCFVPSTIVVVDSHRMYLLGFWSVGLVLAYLLWSNQEHKNSSNAPQKSCSFIRTLLTAITMILAYTIGGSPLIDFPEKSPKVYACEINCSPIFTDNMLGNLYTDIIYKLFYNSQFPMIIDARSISLRHWKYRDHKIVDGFLIIPPDSSGWILYKLLAVTSEHKIRVRIEYASQDIPNLELVIANKASVEPEIRSRTQTTWTMSFDSQTTTVLDIYLLQQEGLAVKVVIIDKITS